jgi:hypothetical protein
VPLTAKAAGGANAAQARQPRFRSRQPRDQQLEGLRLASELTSIHHGGAAVPDIDHALAMEPEDLGRLFLDRANAGDEAGVVALYEPGAVLAVASGGVAIWTEAIRRLYEQLLADRPRFSGEVRSALRIGDLALTSTRFPGGATAEIAPRQRDGRWLWIADQPSIVR